MDVFLQKKPSDHNNNRTAHLFRTTIRTLLPVLFANIQDNHALRGPEFCIASFCSFFVAVVVDDDVGVFIFVVVFFVDVVVDDAVVVVVVVVVVVIVPVAVAVESFPPVVVVTFKIRSFNSAFLITTW